MIILILLACLLCTGDAALNGCTSQPETLSTRESASITWNNQESGEEWTSASLECSCHITAVFDNVTSNAKLKIEYSLESKDSHDKGEVKNGTVESCGPNLTLLLKSYPIQHICPAYRAVDNRSLSTNVDLRGEHSKLTVALINPKQAEIKATARLTVKSGRVSIECGKNENPFFYECPCGEEQPMVVGVKEDKVPLSKRFGIGFGAAAAFLVFILGGFLIHYLLSRRQMKRVDKSIEESKINQSYEITGSDPGYGPISKQNHLEVNQSPHINNSKKVYAEEASSDSGMYSIPSQNRLRGGAENGHTDTTPINSITTTPKNNSTPVFNSPGIQLTPMDIEYEYARSIDEDNQDPQKRPHHQSSVSITGVPQLGAMGPSGLTGSSQMSALTGSAGGILTGMSALGGAAPGDSQLGALTGGTPPNYEGRPRNQRRPLANEQYASSGSPARYNRPIYPVTSSNLTSRASSNEDFRSLSYARSICSSVDSFNTTHSTLSQVHTEV